MNEPSETGDINRLRKLRAVIPSQFNGATVRLRVKGSKTEALCTSTYCYSLDDATKQAIAERIAAAWNLVAEFTTEEIKGMKLCRAHHEKNPQ